MQGVDCTNKENGVDCQEQSNWSIKVRKFLLLPVKVAVAFSKPGRDNVQLRIISENTEVKVIAFLL